MWPHRIAVAIALFWSAACLALAAVVFLNLRRIESPERYLALGLGLVMLYMGGSIVAGMIWPPKPKDPNAPIEIPPLDQVHGRTAYGDDSTFTRNVMLAIGAIFLAASLSAASEAPIVLVIAVVAAGVLVGGVVQIWRQIEFGRARLELDVPARRGDRMRGVITTSGFGWTVADRDLDPMVKVVAVRSYRAGRRSSSYVVAQSSAVVSASRNGSAMTFRFNTITPIIDTSEGGISWNVRLETRSPKYRATFLVDVA